MRIVFIGSVKFSEVLLEYILKVGGNIVGVCTLENSFFNADFSDLSIVAKTHKLPCRYTLDINDDDNIRWISSLKPDILFCFGWSKLIKNKLLSVAPMGILGYHPSLLPKNRGRHPIIWAIALGLNETGSTFFFMDENADSGPILSQEKVPINRWDTSKNLYERLLEVSKKQISGFLPKLINQSYEKKSQNQKKATFWRKRQESDGIIDWRMSANSIDKLVRALTKPYAGADFIYKEKMIKIWECSIVQSKKTHFEPGRVYFHKGKICIKCGQGAITILSSTPDFNPVEGEYL